MRVNGHHSRSVHTSNTRHQKPKQAQQNFKYEEIYRNRVASHQAKVDKQIHAATAPRRDARMDQVVALLFVLQVGRGR